MAFYMLVGVSGSGKSTYARLLQKTQGTDVKIFSSDDIREELYGDASWETYTATKSITLIAGDGQKTVYVKVRDDVGNETSEVSDTIILDTKVPSVSITGPDKSKISKIATFNESRFSFTCDVEFEEYKVCVVPQTSSAQDAGQTIPTTAGSTNTSGSAGGYEASTPIQVVINGADLETASGGDGIKIIKVFVRNAAGTWSVA